MSIACQEPGVDLLASQEPERDFDEEEEIDSEIKLDGRGMTTEVLLFRVECDEEGRRGGGVEEKEAGDKLPGLKER